MGKALYGNSHTLCRFTASLEVKVPWDPVSRVDKAGFVAQVNVLQQGQAVGVNGGVEFRAQHFLPVPETLALLPRP